MYDTLELGSAPCNEECVQVEKSGNYIPAMRAECARYKALLESVFPDTGGAFFSIKSNLHDFGTYYEVVIKFREDSDEDASIAFFVESHLPATWDDTAIRNMHEEKKSVLASYEEA